MDPSPSGSEQWFTRILDFSIRMDWGMMSCGWTCLPNAAPLNCGMMSLVLSAEVLINLLIAADAFPVTFAVSLTWSSVKDRWPLVV